MNTLLDTHVFLWFIMGNERLSEKVRALIEDGNSKMFLSIASLWEISIKTSLGKLKLSEPFEKLIPDQLDACGIDILEIKLAHLFKLNSLPFHHQDPFDRLIICQSMVENITVATIDPNFEKYDVSIVW